MIGRRADGAVTSEELAHAPVWRAGAATHRVERRVRPARACQRAGVRLPYAILLPIAGVLGMVALIGLPIGALLAESASDGLALHYLGDPVVVSALRLSLLTSSAALALAVALGTPTAYLLARHRFVGRRLVETLLDAPMVLPPAVAGIALLMAFGRHGVLGPLLQALGIDVAFTPTAVVLAQAFVASPFYLRAARAGFQGVDRHLEEAAGVDGASSTAIFLRVTAPLALPSLLGGATMAWARALGEFGATIMFAGNTVGRTQTMPLAIYQALETDLNVSLTVAAILVVFSLALLVAVRAVSRGLSRDG